MSARILQYFLVGCAQKERNGLWQQALQHEMAVCGDAGVTYTALCRVPCVNAGATTTKFLESLPFSPKAIEVVSPGMNTTIQARPQPAP